LTPAPFTSNVTAWSQLSRQSEGSPNVIEKH
jgi:hypothetical protein